MQPDSGFTYELRKDSTVVYMIGGKPGSVNLVSNPFPDLDVMAGMQVPFYNFNSTVKAQDSLFLDQLGFISDNVENTHSAVVWFAVLGSLCLVAALICVVVYKMKGDQSEEGSTGARQQRLDKHEQQQNLIEN